jgi:hypothetical protein
VTDSEIKKTLKDILVLTNSMDPEHLNRLLKVLLINNQEGFEVSCPDDPHKLRKATKKMITRRLNKKHVIKSFNHRQMKQIYTIMGDYGRFPVCKICGCPININTEIAGNSATNHASQEFSWDHIYPKSLGGSDDLINLQTTHKLCNNRKADKVLGHDHYVVNVKVDVIPVGRMHVKRKKKLDIRVQLRKQDSWCHKHKDVGFNR